ncbi:hypothetical protein ACFY4C_33405 [Actinomadura viridis]|uniref:hypothetical protein n=1 Tax=Actinomadura viridis TaxID=58110 RepID=UPI00369DD432
MRRIVREAAEAWLLAAGMAMVLAGLVALAVEPGGMLAAVVLLGIFLGSALAVAAYAMASTEIRRHRSS